MAIKIRKAITLTSFCGLLLFGANNVSAETIPLDSVVGVTSVDLVANIEDGVAIVSGTMGAHVEAELAKRHVLKFKNVEKVIDHIYVR